MEKKYFKKKILRIHFQEFINTIHEKISHLRLKKNTNPIEKASSEIASSIALICFDELEIIDIADAMIVSRLFNYLIKKKVFFVITSNYKPNDLYKNGLQRTQFLPFIDLINSEMKVIKIKNSVDLRREKKQETKYFIFPINLQSKKKFQFECNNIIKGKRIKKTFIKCLGRKLKFERTTSQILITDFNYLCSYKFSPNDYIKISNSFEWFLIDNIPILGSNKLSEARRFIVLIDILYEKKKKLVLRSENNLSDMFKLKKIELPFTRTTSRISEMTSLNWHEKK